MKNKHESLVLLIFLKEKQDGSIKGCGVADERENLSNIVFLLRTLAGKATHASVFMKVYMSSRDEMHPSYESVLVLQLPISCLFV